MEVEENSTQGKVINVSVGRGAAGSLSIKGCLGSADGSICVSDARDKVKMLAALEISRGFWRVSRLIRMQIRSAATIENTCGCLGSH